MCKCSIEMEPGVFIFLFQTTLRKVMDIWALSSLKYNASRQKKATYGKNGNKYTRTKLQGLMTACAFSLPALLTIGKRSDDYLQGLKPLSLQILSFLKGRRSANASMFSFCRSQLFLFFPREGQLPEIWERETVNCRILHPNVLALPWGNALQV